MDLRRILAAAASACVALAVTASGQAVRTVRPLGRLERTSSESLASVAEALAMPSGRVLVNDISARRLLLLDSTLARATVVADTTGATGNAYGTRAGTLIRFRGDTALYIDIGSLSMLVIGPTGAIVRVMAVPRPEKAQNLIGSVFGMPGFDTRGRLVFNGGGGLGTGQLRLCCLGSMPGGALGSEFAGVTDSAFVVRADLATRSIDTATAIKIPRVKTDFAVDEKNLLTSIRTTRYPLPVVDDWVVMADGSLAVVRGRDYHLDLLGPDERWTSFPKMTFDWRHVDDREKQTLIDSAARVESEGQQQHQQQGAAALGAGAAAPGSGGGRGGGRGSGGGRAGPDPREIPNVSVKPVPADLPDYAPAFARGAVFADVDDKVWIRTSTIVEGRPVYDIVNRRGEIVDRVQLPPLRTIAGFGPGVVYLAVQGSAGIVRLERVRTR